MSEPDHSNRAQRRAARRDKRPPPGLPGPDWTWRVNAAPAPLPLVLPAFVNCVLARHDPARLVVDLRSAAGSLHALCQTLGRDSTYHVDRRLEAAREQAHDVAHGLELVRRQLVVGRCDKVRGQERYRDYISVRDRDSIDDGGLRLIGRRLDELGDALTAMRGREPFYVRVRDSGLSGARARLSAFALGLAEALGTIAVDVSDADLSGLADADRHLVTNVLWTRRTVWPAGVAERVRTWSRPVCQDVFQIVPASDISA
jgi:hypothetical protein